MQLSKNAIFSKEILSCTHALRRIDGPHQNYYIPGTQRVKFSMLSEEDQDNFCNRRCLIAFTLDCCYSTETPSSQLSEVKNIMLEYGAMERDIKHVLGAVDYMKEQVIW